jgi:enoyl-CoA hydratase
MWSSYEAGSLQGHMDAEGQAQLFVRITTQNFEEATRARKEKRPPEFKD